MYNVGYPGSVHDCRVLHSMDIADNPKKYFSPMEYLLGDSAYANKFSFIVTPYHAPASEIPANQQFNALLSKTRILIEHTFGIMKCRFPVMANGFHNLLQTTEDNRKVCSFIVSIFVLHNLCINSGDDSFEYFVDLENDADDFINEPAIADDMSNVIFREALKEDVLECNGYGHLLQAS